MQHILFFHSYRSLAVKSERGQVEAGGDVNSKRIVATWVVGLGEEASHIQIVPPITKDVPSAIIVLGRRTLYMLQDTGVLTFSRKLDFCATALRAFRPSKLECITIFLNQFDRKLKSKVTNKPYKCIDIFQCWGKKK